VERSSARDARKTPGPRGNMKTGRMPVLGAHMSAAGGLDKAVDRGSEVGCQCVQVFLAAPQAWPKPPRATGNLARKGFQAFELPSETIERFRQAMARHALLAAIAHSSYLINLASPDRALWRKSINAYVIELHRAAQLGIPYVVVHPGACTTSSETAGVRRVIRALDEVHRQTRGLSAECLLENTAGQGTCLGHRFEQLAAILDGVREPERLGICFDTCHAFAAGYALAAAAEYRRTLQDLQRSVGIERVRAIHVNDSKRELGSRVDRHEHIGRGQVGVAAFARLVNDRRFRGIPMVLETPKGTDPRTRRAWDATNLALLRGLVGRPIT